MSYSQESCSSASSPRLGESTLRHATALLLSPSTWTQSEPTSSASFETAYGDMSKSMLASSCLEPDDAKWERFECEFYTLDGDPLPLPDELHIHTRSGLAGKLQQCFSKTKSLIKSLSTLAMTGVQFSETPRRVSQHNDDAINLTAGRVDLTGLASEASERPVARLQMFCNNPAEEAFAVFQKAQNVACKTLVFFKQTIEQNDETITRSPDHEDDTDLLSSEEIESVDGVREAENYLDADNWELL